LRRAEFSSCSFFKASLSAAWPMGADIAINAAKQEAKYFLVLGDPVLVSGFIVICGGWLFSGFRRGFNRADYRQKMGRSI
jgi:hypothetical protein